MRHISRLPDFIEAEDLDSAITCLDMFTENLARLRNSQIEDLKIVRDWIDTQQTIVGPSNSSKEKAKAAAERLAR